MARAVVGASRDPPGSPAAPADAQRPRHQGAARAIPWGDGGTVDAYEAFCNGQWLLEAREYRQAVIALERAKALEPDKASIREALGRAYLASRSYRRAADEFGVAVDLAPTDGYAHYGLAALARAPRRSARAAPLPAAECFGTGLE